MKMRILLSVILLGCLVFNVQAQSFEDVKAPTVPAATAFGYEQSNIEKPSTPRVLTTQLQTAFNGGHIKPGLAIEVAPFWLVNKKDYDLSKYLSDDAKKKNFGRLLGRSLAISFATSPTDSFVLGTLKPGTGLSFGFRMSLAQGKLSKEAQARIAENVKLKDVDLLSFLQDLIKDTKTALKDSAVSFTAESYDVFLRSEIKKDSVIVKIADENWIKSVNTFLKKNFFDNEHGVNLNSETEDIFSKIVLDQENGLLNYLKIPENMAESSKNLSKAITAERVGFKADLSAVIVNVLQDNKWQDISFAKSSVWLTLSYTKVIKPDDAKEKGKFDFITVIRGGFSNKKVDSFSTVDIGMKMAYQYKGFNISAEFIPRIKPASDVKWTYRATVNAEYQINDFIGASLVFGRTFDGTTTTYDVKDGSLFSCVGLNFGLAALKKK